LPFDQIPCSRHVRRAVIDADSRQPSLAEQGTVHIRFVLPLSVNFGDELVLCGASEELGSWSVDSAPRFTWTNSDVWILDAELPASTRTEFKVVHVTASGEHVWEYTNNRVMEIPSTQTLKDGEVTLAWCDESADVAKPRILSSMASWDEEDGSQGGSSMSFGNIFGFMSGEDEEAAGGAAEATVADSELEETPETVDVPIDNMIEKTGDVTAEEETADEGMEEPAGAEPAIAVAETETEEPLSKEAKKNRATAQALKNVTTAGVFLAGIGGAAALAGIAFDAALVDTAMMGLAVAAGGAALSSPRTSKKTTNTTEAEEVVDEADDEAVDEAEE